jgi:hypothetical protein
VPWTVSHAAAVLPFCRWCPARLSFIALVAGSMSPDFGYYLGLYRIAEFAHTVPGIVVVDLPAGLFMVATLRWLREPLVVLLPQPHRYVLRQGLVSLAENVTWSRVMVLAVSLVLGAATHVAWDSFTHATGLPVERSEFLQRELFRIGSQDVETYNFLQHASTLFGIVVLTIAYRSWLKSGVTASAPPPDAQDTLRWWLLGSIVALGAATCAAWVAAAILRGDSDMQSLVVAAVFVASNLIAVVYLAAAFIWRCVQSGRGSGDDPG